MSGNSENAHHNYPRIVLSKTQRSTKNDLKRKKSCKSWRVKAESRCDIVCPVLDFGPEWNVSATIGGLPWNFAQTFMVPRAWIMILWWSLIFPSVIQKNKTALYLSIILSGYPPLKAIKKSITREHRELHGNKKRLLWLYGGQCLMRVGCTCELSGVYKDSAQTLNKVWKKEETKPTNPPALSHNLKVQL